MELPSSSETSSSSAADDTSVTNSTITDRSAGQASTSGQEDISSVTSSSSSSSTARHKTRSSEVRLVAIDMDGTLLDSTSKMLPSSVAAIRAALQSGIKVGRQYVMNLCSRHTWHEQ